MPTRLTILCNRIIEAGWLAALIVVPLYFNPSSTRIFEADKVALLRSVAVIMALAWVVKAIEMWLAGRRKGSAPAAEASAETASWRARLRHPIILAALLLIVSYGLASVFSILPALSLWGQYDRLQGLYTVAAYLVFFFSILGLLRTRVQLHRLITAALLASVPVALYGILQHFDVRLWGWSYDVSVRVHSTMGNAIYLAAYLGLALPLAVYRLIETKRLGGAWLRLSVYLVLIVLHLLCILFTQSRGPVLGLAVGVLFGVLLWMLARRRWRWAKGVLGLGAAFAVLLVIVNLPNSPLSFVQDIPYLNRLARIANTEGSAVGRVLIWEGATALAADDPARLVIGYGPEAIRYAFYPYHTAEIGNLEGWDVVPDRMHNESFDVIVSTGLVGLLIYLLLFTGIVYYAFRWLGVMPSSKDRTLFLTLWFAGALVMVVGLRLVAQTWTFSGVALAAGLLGGALLYLTVYAFIAPRREDAAEAPAAPHPWMLLILLLFAGIMGHFVEINVGIAVSATRLYFWIYTGLLMALALYVERRTDAAGEAPAASEETPRPAPKKKAGASSKKAGASSKKAKKRKRQPKPSFSARLPEGLVSLSLMAGLMLGTVAFSFFSRSVADEFALAIRGFVLALWILTGLLLAVELYAMNGTWLSLRSLAFYGVVAWLPALAFILFKDVVAGGRLFYLALYNLIVLAVLMAFAVWARRAEGPRLQKIAPMSLVAGVVLAVAAGVFIHQTNIQIVQANLYHNGARSAMQQQRYDPAITQYRRALALDPGQGLYQLELAQALVSKGVYTQVAASQRDQLFGEAEDILLDAVTTNPFEPYHRAQLAEIHRIWSMVSEDQTRQASSREKAVSYLDEALQYNRQNILFLKKWAQIEEQFGNPAEALEMYEELLRWDSTDVSLYLQLGETYQAKQRWQDAAAMYEGALRQRRRLPEAQRHLVTVYQQLGRPGKALQAGRRLVALEPDSLANHTLVLDLYQRTGQCNGALQQTRASLDRWPDNEALQTQASAVTQQCTDG